MWWDRKDDRSEMYFDEGSATNSEAAVEEEKQAKVEQPIQPWAERAHQSRVEQQQKVEKQLKEEAKWVVEDKDNEESPYVNN